MLGTFRSLKDDRDREKNGLNARRLFAIEVIARLAQLMELLRMNPKLTPFEYYAHQRVTGDMWVLTVREELKHLGMDGCTKLVEWMRLAPKDFVNDFPEDKKFKGFLSPMIKGFITSTS